MTTGTERPPSPAYRNWLEGAGLAYAAHSFTDIIPEFKGEYRFLSNPFPSPLLMNIGWGSIEYPSVEYVLQAAKAYFAEDHDRIAYAPTWREAKKRGRQVTLRSDWEEIKPVVVRWALSVKFPADPEHELTRKLLDTGTAVLVEGNNWGDQEWGAAPDLVTLWMTGRNLLGVLLMERRGAIRAQLEGGTS